MRIKFLTVILALIGVLTVAFASAVTQDAMAGQKSLAGSWTVLVVTDPPGPPPFTNLATVTKDGSVINSSPTFGTGHGAWAKLGRGEFAITFVTLVPSDIPDFPPDTSFTVSGTLTIDEEGNEATGPITTIFNDADGNELISEVGTLTLTRLMVEE